MGPKFQSRKERADLVHGEKIESQKITGERDARRASGKAGVPKQVMKSAPPKRVL